MSVSHKIKAHPDGGKHSWEWIGDVEWKESRLYINLTVTHTVKLRGKYKCSCGEFRLGKSKS